MDSPGVLRGSLVLLLVFSCVPLKGHPHTSEEPDVPFPPACPSLANLNNICFHEPNRPRYPPDSLPTTGRSYLRRRGDAINLMETLYQKCCEPYGHQWLALTLSCLQEAWKGSLSKYCQDEFSVKAAHYHCCLLEDKDQYNCFEREAPNPTYKLTPTKN